MKLIDDFLIDKVFQRISNFIAPLISCYGLANILLSLGCIFLILGTKFTDPIAIICLALVFFFWAIWAFRANELDRSAQEGVMPIDRPRDMTVRLVYFFFLLWAGLEDLLKYLFHTVNYSSINRSNLLDVAWLFATLGLYFIACRKMPPLRKTSYSFSFFNFSEA
jgi:hypothetical protein